MSLPAPAIFHDAALQAKFAKEGAVTLTALAPEAASRLREILAGLAPDDGFDPDGRLAPMMKYHMTELDDNGPYKRQVYEIAQQWLEPLVDELLIDYRLLGATLVVKPPGKGSVQVHNDWAVQEDASRPTVYLWCALDDTTEENGALQIVPASHGLISALQGPTILPDYSPCAQMLHDSARPRLLKRGEAVVFDPSGFHRSDDNHSSAHRFGLRLSCIPKGRTGVLHRRSRTDQDMIETFRMEVEDYFELGGADLLQANFKTPKLSERRQPAAPIEPSEMAEILSRSAEIRAGTLTVSDIIAAARRNTPAISLPEPSPGLALRLYRKLRRHAGRMVRGLIGRRKADAASAP